MENTHYTSGSGILKHMGLMKTSYEDKLTEMNKKIEVLAECSSTERKHFKFLNDCRSWIEHKPDRCLI